MLAQKSSMENDENIIKKTLISATLVIKQCKIIYHSEILIINIYCRV